VTVALHGNLQDFGIGEVFQLIGQQRKTGVLEVRGEQGEVELRFDSGGVVAADGVMVRDRATELDQRFLVRQRHDHCVFRIHLTPPSQA